MDALNGSMRLKEILLINRDSGSDRYCLIEIIIIIKLS